ncbi:hypothetical protein ANN_18453 [Periplaneta americana]|uniref:Uncharacterized protein n=1 Tax=Periplaneta americana TaxID=6978 RepID=A0ABQ8SNT2_PERAM|nr:hypothetical protein ANN_18453 [Periplaneta americana]
MRHLNSANVAGSEAPLHWHTEVQRYLNQHLSGQWIDRATDETAHGHPVHRISQCDFFLWGFVKDSVYIPSLLATLAELRRRTNTAIRNVTYDMSERVWQEWDHRLTSAVLHVGPTSSASKGIGKDDMDGYTFDSKAPSLAARLWVSNFLIVIAQGTEYNRKEIDMSLWFCYATNATWQFVDRLNDKREYFIFYCSKRIGDLTVTELQGLEMNHVCNNPSLATLLLASFTDYEREREMVSERERLEVQQQQQQQQAWGSYSLSLTLCSLPLSPFSLPCLGELRPAILNNDPARSSCARRELTKLSPRTSERMDGRTPEQNLHRSMTFCITDSPNAQIQFQAS